MQKQDQDTRFDDNVKKETDLPYKTKLDENLEDGIDPPLNTKDLEENKLTFEEADQTVWDELEESSAGTEEKDITD